jgi:glyoxylase-like metal-dependent hydrolase (beta-lactamase superfamily II)
MAGSTPWRKAGIAGVILAVAAAVWWIPLRRAPTLPAVPIQLFEPRALAIAPPVYLLGKTQPSPVYAVDTSDGLVLVDSGLEADAAAVKAQLAELGLEVGRLRAILLTHLHGDHSQGAQTLRSQTGAKVYAGRGDCDLLRRGGPREAFFATFAMPGVTLHPTTVDVELNGEEVIDLGDTRFRALATPGHTPGSICYLMERGDLRALFTGDVLQNLNPSLPGSHGTYTVYLAPRYRGNARDYLASLRRLRALTPPPDLVFPGHPWADPLPRSPRMTLRHWQFLLDGEVAELERLVARYEADGANFLDGNPKELLAGLHYLGDCEGWAVYCLQTTRDFFLVDAPGGPALLDFLARRFGERGWEGRKPTAVLLTSADPRATAGLRTLVESTGCRVLAPQAALADVQRRCPPGTRTQPAEELEKNGDFEVQVIPLRGLGLAPVAYRLRWAGKNVLFSGRMPMQASDPAGIERLQREIVQTGGSAEPYLESLRCLAQVNPDLWLPALPAHGQNANLYDQDWLKVLQQNRRLVP